MAKVVRIAIAVFEGTEIAVFEGTEELDFVGPWEVLTGWRFLYPDDVEVFLVGEDSAWVTCAQRMRVLADRSWEEAGDVDVLVYPGGRGTRAQLGDEGIRARLRALKERGTLMTSVCTGALVYADAGLLDEQPAASHWSAFDELLQLGRKITPRPDDHFVDNADIITAAGVSAGIDMALHLVGRLGSPRRRARCAATSSTTRSRPTSMERAVTVACVQAEPAILDREATLDRLERLARRSGRQGRRARRFPETFVAIYPSSRWAKA